MNYSEALQYFESGNISSCIDYFKNNNYTLEYGYSLFLSGNIAEAYEVLKNIESRRADWICRLIKIIYGSVKDMPSYFQIRNFLEIDITLLFKSKQFDYIKQIINYADYFQEINSESYKFIARALLKNDCPKECKYFLDKSLGSFYNDVELHYLFAEYYLYMKDFHHAKYAVDNCLRINPDYYPAQKTYKELMAAQL